MYCVLGCVPVPQVLRDRDRYTVSVALYTGSKVNGRDDNDAIFLKKEEAVPFN